MSVYQSQFCIRNIGTRLFAQVFPYKYCKVSSAGFLESGNQQTGYKNHIKAFWWRTRPIRKSDKWGKLDTPDLANRISNHWKAAFDKSRQRIEAHENYCGGNFMKVFRPLRDNNNCHLANTKRQNTTLSCSVIFTHTGQTIIYSLHTFYVETMLLVGCKFCAVWSIGKSSIFLVKMMLGLTNFKLLRLSKLRMWFSINQKVNRILFRSFVHFSLHHLEAFSWYYLWPNDRTSLRGVPISLMNKSFSLQRSFYWGNIRFVSKARVYIQFCLIFGYGIQSRHQMFRKPSKICAGTTFCRVPPQRKLWPLAKELANVRGEYKLTMWVNELRTVQGEIRIKK